MFYLLEDRRVKRTSFMRNLSTLTVVWTIARCVSKGFAYQPPSRGRKSANLSGLRCYFTVMVEIAKLMLLHRLPQSRTSFSSFAYSFRVTLRWYLIRRCAKAQELCTAQSERG